MVLYDNEFETKENKISTKDKIEPQHVYITLRWIEGNFAPKPLVKKRVIKN